MGRFATFELDAYPRRVVMMAVAAVAALVIDFVSKDVPSVITTVMV